MPISFTTILPKHKVDPIYKSVGLICHNVMICGSVTDVYCKSCYLPVCATCSINCLRVIHDIAGTVMCHACVDQQRLESTPYIATCTLCNLVETCASCNHCDRMVCVDCFEMVSELVTIGVFHSEVTKTVTICKTCDTQEITHLNTKRTRFV